MSTHAAPKLSLAAAILININIMLGTGLFINTVLVPQKVGALGFMLYLITGALFLPLALCIAQLTSLYKEGNFYIFGSTLTPYWGFISTWSYFMGKLASASVSIHVFSTFLCSSCPTLATLPSMSVDIMCVSLFVFLNLQNMKTGKHIQTGFFVMKLIPLLFAILFGLSHANIINVAAPHLIWSGISIALPLALFSGLGFEAICSLTRVMDNPQKNGPIAILASFGIIIFLAALYQLSFYLSLGTVLTEQTNYNGAFSALIEHTAPSLTFLESFFSIAIATSALGGAYGILYSNPWNLYTLAQKEHTFFSRQLSALNSYSIPTLCVIAEGLVCSVYLLGTQGALIPLQYTATLSCILTYSVSVFVLFKLKKSFLSLLGLLSCSILLCVSLYGFLKVSLIPLAILAVVLAAGTSMFFVKEKSAA